MKAERRCDAVWLGLILGYALFGALLRPLYGAGMSYDEAEAFYYARDLRLGYDAQPPLYFWLQWVLFGFVGETVFALGLLKAAGLALIGGALYGLLREAHPPRLAGLATLGLALLPDVLWRSQRALTHSVLTLGFTILATWLFWRALRSGRLRDWGWLGLALGLGMLSKWNYLLVPVALSLAALWLPETRRALRPAGLGLAGGIVIAMVAGPALWTLDNFERATNTFDKMGFDAAAGPPAFVMAPLAMLVTLGAVWGLLIVVAGPMAWRLRDRPGPAPQPLDRFLCGLTLTGIALLFAVMLLTGATRMQNHWLLPLAYLAAPLVLLRLLPRLAPAGQRRFAGAMAAMWIGALALLFYEGRVDPGWRGLDYARVADRISDLGGASPVATNEIRLAGILPTLLNGRAVLFLPDAPPLPEGPLVWITMPRRPSDMTAEDMATARGREVAARDSFELRRGFRDTAFDLVLSR